MHSCVAVDVDVDVHMFMHVHARICVCTCNMHLQMYMHTFIPCMKSASGRLCLTTFDSKERCIHPFSKQDTARDSAPDRRRRDGGRHETRQAPHAK